MAVSTPARNTRSRSREQQDASTTTAAAATPTQTQTTEPTNATSTTSSSKTPLRPSAGRRRKSSILGGDPRGDTGGGSMATTLTSQTIRNTTTPSQSDPQPTKAGSGGVEQRGRKRRRSRSFLLRCVRVCLKHTWVIPLVLTLILLALYYVSPGEHNPLHSAIFLSYANPPLNERTNTLPAHIGDVTQYGKGKKDFAFVAFYTIVLSFTREFLMQCLIKPIALWCGVRGRGKQVRFMEQFYTAIYFAIFGPFGLYVMSRSPVWYFNTKGMYEGFPHRSHEAVFKAYYLLQASYWAQQALVLMLQLEKPRKDFKELVLHHIVTLALIFLSYRFHFTYMGAAVYITHDISDFFLATSKILNYLDSQLAPPFFVTFVGVWAYARHYINLVILYSMLPGGDFTTVGSFELNWETQQYKCWISQIITFCLLATLQAVNIFWFVLILRILWRYITSDVVEDTRSDDEEEEEEVPVITENPAPPKLVLNGEPVAIAASGIDDSVNKDADLSRRR